MKNDFKSTGKEHKSLETITILALACIVFGLLLKLQILFYLSLSLLFIGIFLKGLSEKIAQGWLKFASILGTVNTKVILTIIFYLFLTPISFLYRIFNKDPMNISFNIDAKTYWNERNHMYRPEDFKNIW